MIKKLNYRNIANVLLAFVFILLTFRILYYISMYASNVPFWDQWDYFNTIFENKSYLDSFLYVHAPHRQGIGFVIDRFILETVQLDTRSSSYLIAFIYLMSSLIAVGIKNRLVGKNDLHSIIIPFFFLTIGFFETMILTPNPSHGAFPVFILLLFAFMMQLKWNSLLKVGLLLLLDLFAVFTGFSVFAGLIIPFLFLPLAIFENGSKKKITLYIFATIASLFIFALFFYKYQFHSASDCFQFPHPRPLEYLDFMIYVNAFQVGLQDSYFIGSIMFLVYLLTFFLSFFRVVKGFFITHKFSIFYLVIFFLISFALLFEMNIAVGRVCFGVKAGQSSRYLPYLNLGVFAVYLAFLKEPFFSKLTKNILILLVLIFFVLQLFKSKQIDLTLKHHKVGKENWIKCYKETKDLGLCQSTYQIYPYDHLIEKKLLILETNHWSFFHNENNKITKD